VAVVVAAVIAVIVYQVTRPSAPAYSGSGPHPFAVRNGQYGPPIKMPQSALAVARAFIHEAVLRENPGASWDLVTPQMRSGSTRAQWATGNIPVTPFPKADLGRVLFKVERSRARDILLQVEISSTNTSVQAAYDYLEMVPAGANWRVKYFAPVGYSVPIPAAQ
jgi:hypothetical protein